MCGRFTITAPPDAMRMLFEYEEQPNLAPRFNVAPTQPVAVVRRAENGRRELVFMRWGLVPSWATDPSMAARMINARAETLAQKPAFREAFRQRRCLVPADGFYEWREEDGRRQAFRIGMRGGGVFAFAGLWERWTASAPAPSLGLAAGESVDSVTIVTTAANDKLRPIHERMPVILPPADHSAWLDVEAVPPERARALLKPYPVEPMAFYRVGPRVNSVRNDDRDCIVPLRVAAG
jgi:putative SOS response-associated peptidase YedK